MTKLKFLPLLLIITLLFTCGFSNAKEPEYRTVINFLYDGVYRNENTYIIEKGNKYGVLDSTGNTVMKLQSYEFHKFMEGLTSIYSNKKFGFMDMSGKVVISPKWDFADNFYDGLAGIRVNYKYGFVDKNGNTVIKPQWDYVGRFSNGVTCVMMCNEPVKVPHLEMLFYQGLSGFGRWGLINKAGNILIEAKWDRISPMIGNESLFIVSSYNSKTGYKYGIADTTGKFLINPSLGAVTYFSDGMNLSPVCQNGKWGFMDRKGKIVTKFEWDKEPKILNGADKLWQVVKKDTTPGSFTEFFGALDDTGKTVIEPIWNYPFYFREGITLLEQKSASGYKCDNLYGYAGSAGVIIVNPDWSQINNFSDGIAWVYGKREADAASEGQQSDADYEKTRYCWRPIDKTGQYMSLTGWDDVADFKNGYAAVSNKEGKSTIIDKNLNVICDLDYDVETCLSDNAFVVEKNKRYGVVDKTGKAIHQIEWNEYTILDDPNLKLRLTKISWSTGDKYGLIGASDKLLGSTTWDSYDSGKQDNLLQVWQGGKVGFINLTQETLAVSPQFDDVRYLYTEKGESIWAAMKNGKWGVIAIKISKV